MKTSKPLYLFVAVCFIAGLFAAVPLTASAAQNSSDGSIGISSYTPLVPTAQSNVTEVTPITPEMPINPFADVFGTDWFIDAVIYVNAKGLISGTSTSPMLFSPDMTLTRGMVATVLWRMGGSSDTRMPAAVDGGQFTDVTENAFYYQAVNWAVANGIANGVEKDLFAPDAAISRQDLAVILMRYMNFLKISIPVTQQFIFFADDEEISDYANDAIQTLYKLGIINGVDANEGGQTVIDPKGTATRAQAAAILHRFMRMVE